MAGPIQQIPQGLLGLLQLKELGRNPDQLVETVAPNLDLFNLYAERPAQGVIGLFGGNPTTGTFATGSIGPKNFQVGAVNVSVPQTEMWYVTNASISIVGGAVLAADTMVVQLGWLTFGGPGSDLYAMSPVFRDVITTRNRFLNTDPMPRPMFIPPGALFVANIIDNLAGTTQNLQLSMRATRIPI